MAQGLKETFARNVWPLRVQDYYEVSFKENFVTGLKAKLDEFANVNTGIPSQEEIDTFCAGIQNDEGLQHHVCICLNRAKKDTETMAKRWHLT